MISLAIALLGCTAFLWHSSSSHDTLLQTALAQSELKIANTRGLRLEVIENQAPMVRILLPNQSEADRGIEVIFPEHITARQHGKTIAEHLYLSTVSSQAFQ